MSDPESLTRELEDTDERPGFDWSRLDLSRLLQPNAIRRIAGIAVALALIFWPERTNLLVGRLIGIGLIVYAATSLWAMRKDRPFPWLGGVAAVVAVGFGGFMAVAPAKTEVALGRFIGLALVVLGVWGLAKVGIRRGSDLGWRIASSLALVATGIFVALFPSELLAFLTVALALIWIVVELISLAVILDPDRDADAPRTDTTVLIRQWFADRPKTVDDRQRLYGELLYEGPRAATKITRFVMLMIFASIIASMGVVADSTAVVVGAMLIAPLMTPLMAMAMSLVMGWPNRLGRSSLIALGGIVLAIAIGFVIGLADFTIVDTMTNSQIVSRSNPTTIDLVTACAAGAAGAYGLSRPDVSNSLPGVAIAIALVPPLTVIGISYSQGDSESGNGAMLLFATNAIAILVVGGIVFLLTGVAPLQRATANQYRVRTSLATIGAAAAIIIGALVLNGTNVASNVFEQRAVQRVVAAWVEPFPDHSTIEVGVTGDNVSVILAGPALGTNPTADDLATQLTDELGRKISVDLRIRLETQEVSGGSS